MSKVDDKNENILVTVKSVHDLKEVSCGKPDHDEVARWASGITRYQKSRVYESLENFFRRVGIFLGK